MSRLLDRDYVRMRGTRDERCFYHGVAAHLKKEAIEARVALGRRFMEEHRDGHLDFGLTIDRELGYAAADLSASQDIQLVVGEAQTIVRERENTSSPSKGSLIALASGKKELLGDSLISQFARSPIILLPIIEYFGMLPILFSVGINRASSSEIIDWSSHLYHLDPEDITQIKVFIHLVDVDEETRPFTALSAELSKQVARKFNYTVGRLTDERVNEVVGEGKEKVFLGPAGSVAFCDTSRCFHFGGRPGARIRDMLAISYVLPTATWFPLHAKDGVRRDLVPHFAARDEDRFDAALLGRDLII